VALVGHIERRLPKQVIFPAPPDEGLDLVLAVQGCATACADLAAFEGLPVYMVKGPGDADGFLDRIDALMRGE